MVEDVFAIGTQVLLFAVLIVAATTDIMYRKVHNWLTYPAIAFGLTLGYAAGGLPQLQNHFYGLMLGVAVFGVARLAGGMGGGDWKLVGAIGAIKGIPFIVPAIFYSGLVGCALALGVLAYRGRLAMGVSRSARHAVGLSLPALADEDPIKKRLPYGVAIAFGTMLAWALTEEVIV